MQHWTVGDIDIHAVPQAVIPIPPTLLFAGALERCADDSLADYCDASGNILMAIQSYLIASEAAQHGKLRLVGPDHQLTEAVRLVPTAGHIPGHVSVRIESAGAVAYISGDVVHHPVQIGDPEISARPDADASAARASRLDLLRRVADERALLLGSHFAVPSGGYIKSAGAGLAWQPLVEREGAR